MSAGETSTPFAQAHEESERHRFAADAGEAENQRMAHGHKDERVIIIAPVGQDASAMSDLLYAEGFETHVCYIAEECSREIIAGVGVFLLTEEALELPGIADVLEMLKAQPAWSELPLIILTSGGQSRVSRLLDLAEAAAGNVTLLERPLPARTLVRSVQVASRSRRRQYEVRDLLEQQQRDQRALQERVHHQQTLYTLVNALTRADSVHDVFQAALDSIQNALYCDRSAILLCDDAGVMRFAAWRGISDEYRAAVEGHSPWSNGARDPQSVYFSDMTTAPFEPWLQRTIQKEGVNALAFFPLLSHDKLLGKLVVYYNAPHAFNADELQLAQAIARHVAFGLERKDAEESLREAQTELANANQLLMAHAQQLEQVVERRTAELRETVQQLETFSYSVVHDMRAPLRSMRSFASLIEAEYGDKLDEQGRDYLSRIMSSSSRLDALITDVLSYSRVAISQTELQRVNLDKLVPEILDQYPQFQQAAAAIRVEHPLPIVNGNKALLTQVFSNLLGNAIKFMPPERAPSVAVRAEWKAERVRIWVEDNGIGIKPEYRDKVFELFQRLHGPDKYSGTGVGLAIVKKAVERMGGTVGFESEPGRGTRFWIELPST